MSHPRTEQAPRHRFLGRRASTDARVPNWRRALASLAAAFLAIGGLAGALPMVAAAPAQAASSTNLISSTGPLTKIYSDTGLKCQIVNPTASAYGAFFNGYTTTSTANCYTSVAVNGTLYGPLGFNSYTSTSQVVGAATQTGTRANPFTITNNATAGVVKVSKLDAYVQGDTYYTTTVTLQNTSGSAVPVRLSQYADCYAGGADSGTNALVPGYSVSCVGDAVTQRLVTNETSGVSLAGGSYSAISSYLTGAGRTADLPNACYPLFGAATTAQCQSKIDNGYAMMFSRTIPAGATITLSY